jgi:tetratricopeptide (TPR) repeat protein
LALEPQYYKSCVYLSQRKYREFIGCANHYLFKGKPGSMPYVMTKYYLGMVHCYVNKDYHQASKNVFECIATKPLMAEFWCLLGDIYHSLDIYDKAYSFYENAMILGSRRLKNDDWPFQIDKYKKHPESMMKNCADIKGKSKLYIANR